MSKTKQKKSEDEVLNFLNSTIEFMDGFQKLKANYEFYNNSMVKLEQATQDILHKFELDKMTSSEKNKWATKLANIRKDRRYYKNKALTLKMVIDLIEELEKDIQFTKGVNKFGNNVGAIRKKYLNLPNRVYSPKVIKEMVIVSQEEKTTTKNKT